MEENEYGKSGHLPIFDCTAFASDIIVSVINANAKCNPHPNPIPKLNPYPTPNQKPNHYPHSTL